MNSAAALGETGTRASLPAIPLFSHLADELLRTISEAGTVRAFAAGEAVFHDGDPGDCLYSVLAGGLRVSKTLEDGTEVELGRLGPGDSFGELALLDGGPRSNTVEAVTPCHLFSLGREAFLDALPESPRLVAAVLSNLVAHIRASSEHLLREELEQRAIRAEMELERLRALTQMVAGVAHEINTPLGIVNTAASVVRQRVSSPALAQAIIDSPARAEFEDIREAISLIHANIERAHKLVGSFKQLSAGQIADVKEPLPIVAVVEDAVGLFAISARKAQLEMQIVNTLPGGSDESWLGYRGLLTQVVLNLLTNIERYAYSDHGGRIEIWIGGKESHFTITVRDFGRGIPAEAISRVFEPFYTTGRAKGATGLGLAIVHNLVTSAMKGRVEVTSTPGSGTSVTITVPKSIPD